MKYVDRTPNLVAEILRKFPQQIDGSTLGHRGQSEEGSEKRPIVRIVRCSLRLLDPGNVGASNKIILDRLVEAGLIPGDEEKDIILDDRHQIQVGTAAEVGTSVTIRYPG